MRLPPSYAVPRRPTLVDGRAIQRPPRREILQNPGLSDFPGHRDSCRDLRHLQAIRLLGSLWPGPDNPGEAPRDDETAQETLVRSSAGGLSPGLPLVGRIPLTSG